jgi:diguanylate cyclase (GGDEF)-like protein
MKLADRQRAFRKPFVAAIVVTDMASEEQISAHTSDLSMHGCFVATTTPLNPGVKVRINMVHAGSRAVVFGDVTYARADGMGIGFTRIGQGDQVVLERWSGLEGSAEEWHEGWRVSPPAMTETAASVPEQNVEAGKPAQMAAAQSVTVQQGDGQTFRENLIEVNHKAWLYWWTAVLAMLLMVGAMVLLSLPRLLREVAPAFQTELTTAVSGLLGLALIFNLYTLYQQHLLSDMRQHLATQLAIAREHKNQSEALYELSVIDPLTGLFNRRVLESRLSAEMKRARRFQSQLVAMLLDLDNFKALNDSRGHVAGDLALKEFARRVMKAIRGSDFAARIGGDEFLVLLTECPPEKVRVVLSRLDHVEIALDAQRFSVSSSCGWARYEPGETAEQLIARADAALYASKASRRKQD